MLTKLNLYFFVCLLGMLPGSALMFVVSPGWPNALFIFLCWGLGAPVALKMWGALQDGEKIYDDGVSDFAIKYAYGDMADKAIRMASQKYIQSMPVFGKNHLDRIHWMVLLGRLHLINEDQQKAREYLDEARELLLKWHGKPVKSFALLCNTLAEACLEFNVDVDAEALIEAGCNKLQGLNDTESERIRQSLTSNRLRARLNKKDEQNPDSGNLEEQILKNYYGCRQSYGLADELTHQAVIVYVLAAGVLSEGVRNIISEIVANPDNILHSPYFAFFDGVINAYEAEAS